MPLSPRVIISADLRPKPSKRELEIAYLLMDYFQQNVKFVPRGLLKSADYQIGRAFWELKSPTGKGKHNIQHTLERAVKQCDRKNH